MFKIGVTGTRNGIDETQLTALVEFMQEVISGDEVEFHHGDCVGADVTAAIVAKELGCTVVCHPPIKTALRAYHNSDKILDPKDYFERNREIVDQVELLIVLPKENERQIKGGTWYTHDYALKTGKPVYIIYPEVTK